MRAYILVTTAVGKADEVSELLHTMELDKANLVAVDLVAGVYDLIVVVETDDPKLIGQLVVGTIQRTEGVTGTVTLLRLG